MQIIPGIEKTTSYIKKCKKSVDRIAVSVYNKIVAETKQQTRSDARVAQLVEHNLAKVGAAGSSPVSRFCYTLI